MHGALVVFSAMALSAGCAPMPSLTFVDDEAGTDATLAIPDVDADGASRDAAEAPRDATRDDAVINDAPPTDATASDAARDDAAIDSGQLRSEGGILDAAPAEDARACLPSNAPHDAGCCFGVLPCVGLGCSYCTDCVEKACHVNQFCCAHLNGQGDYQGVQCSGDGKNCP